MKTAIIPQIKEVTLLEKSFDFSEFCLNSSVAEQLWVAPEIFKENEYEKGNKPIIFVLDENIASEAYRMEMRADKISIYTSDLRGLQNGLFTISELAIVNHNVLTECDIYDEPALAFRAFSDDISRGQISTIDNFFAIIRRLARYKYNTYMPYIEDVFKFESIPAWGRYSDPVGKDEWQAIIAYASSYQMDVRPIINLLGHFDKSCNIKELQPLVLRKLDGSPSHVLDPKNPQVREAIVKILDEIVDTFGEGIIHAGGDEPLELTRVYGQEEAGNLFIQHYTFISEELKKRNCTLMMYADFFAPPWGDYSVPIDRASELPAETEFVFWDYGVRPAYPFVSALHNQNLKLYISPGSWTWKRFACDLKLSFHNTKGLLKEDNGRSLGMIMSSWADGGDTLRELNWPGICVGANYCWSPNSDYSYEEFYALFHLSFYGFSEQEALLLDPIYHYDYFVTRADEHEFKLQMFADPALPVSFQDIEHVSAVQEAMAKAKTDYEFLMPVRNHEAFHALELSIARIAFTANKIAWLPSKPIETYEEAIPYSKVAMTLAAEVLSIKELHEKLWFESNRCSEWPLCACRYDDLYDQLRMFARATRLGKIFHMPN